jgi:hypothetical protein
MFCFPREEKDSDVFILAGQPAQSINNILWYRPLRFITAAIRVAARNGVIELASLMRTRRQIDSGYQLRL